MTHDEIRAAVAATPQLMALATARADGWTQAIAAALPSGVTLTGSPVITPDVRCGAGAPGDLLVGAPTVQGGIVLQKVQGAGAPADYALRCVAQCSDGLPRVIVMALPVRRQ